MNHTKYRNSSRRNQVSFPSFANIINDIMNAPLHSVADKKVHSTPAVNVKQNDERYTIEMSIPGYSKTDINIAINEGKLVIKSELEKTTSENYKLQEFSFGAFSRTFNLPKDANQEDIVAKVSNGILNLTIGKIPEAAPKKIEIQ